MRACVRACACVCVYVLIHFWFHLFFSFSPLLYFFPFFLYVCGTRLLQTSLSCFISTLLLALFAQPRIIASSVFPGLAGRPWGRDPAFRYIEPVFWDSLPLSVRHSSSLSSSNSKLKLHILHIDLLFLFAHLLSHQPITSRPNACIFVVRA